MKIELNNITIRELVEGYTDDQEGGVIGYGGKLDIRPPYQREFVYKDDQRDAVIDTINKGFPLNVMYWADRGDDTYEVIDGQQRTISICEYFRGNFSVLRSDGPKTQQLSFHNLQDSQKEAFLDYELQIYICDGTDVEKMDWFQVINIGGEELSKQELRNAVYTGVWVTDAKRYFSKRNGPAYDVGKDYLNAKYDRQGYLETAIKWHKQKAESIEGYMSRNQRHPTATDLWSHFNVVLERTKALFPKYREEMKGVDWGQIYRDHMQDSSLDPNELEQAVDRLMGDSDIKKKSGIYTYVFDGDEHHLNIRAFDSNTKRDVYQRQKGVCNNKECKDRGKKFGIKEMEADHITPWSKGGHTTPDNCQLLCVTCNRRKGNK